jgi:outer membrane lipoprotein-sorting protein
MSGSRLRPARVTVGLAALSVAAVVAVVVAFGAPAAPSSAAIGADAGDAYGAIEGVDATRITTVERGGDVHRTVASVALQPGTDNRRIEVLEATDRLHEVVVENDTTVWLYDRDADEVSRFPSSGSVAGPTFGDRVEHLFDRLSVTRADDSETVDGVSPLPVVPEGAGRPTATTTDAGALRLSYEGTADVDGRETHVLALTTPGGDAGAFEQTIWVDATRFFPLKRHTSWVADGERTTVTTVYENATFDPGLDADTFTYEPPANATVETLETPERTAYATLDRLRSATDVSVPSPDVPASLRLAVATETTGEVHGVGLRYVNETAVVSVAKYNRTFPARGDRQVTVAGREAAVTLGTTTSVSWNCGEYRYTVRGEGVDAAALVAVAQSVGCE